MPNRPAWNMSDRGTSRRWIADRKHDFVIVGSIMFSPLMFNPLMFSLQRAKQCPQTTYLTTSPVCNAASTCRQLTNGPTDAWTGLNFSKLLPQLRYLVMQVVEKLSFWYCRSPFDMHLIRSTIPPAPLLLSAAQSPADIALRRLHFLPWNSKNVDLMC